jgi:hypothetical protein
MAISYRFALDLSCMERETFALIAERAALYQNVRRRGQLVRPSARAHAPAPAGFFAGLAARAAGYSGCAET